MKKTVGLGVKLKMSTGLDSVSQEDRRAENKECGGLNNIQGQNNEDTGVVNREIGAVNE